MSSLPGSLSVPVIMFGKVISFASVIFTLWGMTKALKLLFNTGGGLRSIVGGLCTKKSMQFRNLGKVSKIKVMPRKENWDRRADKEYLRREKVLERLQAKATKSRERAERIKWDKEIQQEEQRRTKVTAAETKKRERTSF